MFNTFNALKVIVLGFCAFFTVRKSFEVACWRIIFYYLVNVTIISTKHAMDTESFSQCVITKLV